MILSQEDKYRTKEHKERLKNIVSRYRENYAWMKIEEVMETLTETRRGRPC